MNKLSGMPRIIGTTKLWTGRIYFVQPVTPADLQERITAYTRESRITVVGYHMKEPCSLTLLRWPETRPEYRSPSVTECEIALSTLAHRLKAKNIERSIVPSGMLHVMMGRKIGGYDKDGLIAPPEAVTRIIPSNQVRVGRMISARTVGDTDVEPYSEPVSIIVVQPEHESKIHQVGDELRQLHYAVERADRGQTDLYETRWAATA